jgi:hypothetical protein
MYGLRRNLSRRTLKMTIKRTAKSSIRIESRNLNHHLYNNNGTWWLHYTSYPTPVTSKRLRRSLKTSDLSLARSRRDAFFGELFDEQGMEVLG